MGLLEDAIREHLELKRLRGADPTEVAREQREALEPPTAEADPAWVENHAAVGEDGSETGHVSAADVPTGGDHAGEIPQASFAGDLTHAGQETAELDMNAVMSQEPAIEHQHPLPEGSDSPAGEGEPSAVSAEEDSLEWEVPARSHDAETESAGQDVEGQDDSAETAGEQDTPQASADEERDARADTQEHSPGQGRLSL
jgi:hypothetical protein